MIGIISDIHSNYLVFKKIIEDAKKRGVDKFLFLGDYTTDGFDADKVIKDIMKLNHESILGNRDLDMILYDENKYENWTKLIDFKSKYYSYKSLSKESIGYLKKLDIYKIVTINNKKICMSHGSCYDVREMISKDDFLLFDKLIDDYDCDIYLFGHSHLSFCTSYKNRLFINPGTAGLTTREKPFKYGILDIKNDDVKYYNVDIDVSYEELYNYYKESEYSTYAKEWCEIILQCFKDAKNHQSNFGKMVREKIENENIDDSMGIPDDVFLETFLEYKRNNF